MLIGHSGDVLGVDEHGRANNAEQPKDVDLTAHGNLVNVGVVGFNILRWFLLVVVRIYNVVGDEQQHTAERPFGNKVEEPCEFGTLQEEQEERRVTKWGKQTTAVGHDGDEEQDGVCLVLAFRNGLDEQTDQEHGGTRSAHKRSQHKADG